MKSEMKSQSKVFFFWLLLEFVFPLRKEDQDWLPRVLLLSCVATDFTHLHKQHRIFKILAQHTSYAYVNLWGTVHLRLRQFLTPTPTPSAVFYYYPLANLANFLPFPPKKCWLLKWMVPDCTQAWLQLPYMYYYVPKIFYYPCRIVLIIIMHHIIDVAS